MNRRDELLDAALRLFAEKGFDGASVADLVGEVGMSKAAFGYHLESKDDLLVELVSPLIDNLERTVEAYPHHPRFPDELELLLSDYIDVLLGHRPVVVWVDGDKAVTSHAVIGERLRANNQAMRRAIRGDNRSSVSRLLAASALGMVWRPIRNLVEVEIEEQKSALLNAVLGVAKQARAAG